MKKLNLDVSELRVESFETDLTSRGIGTVQGHNTAAATECGTVLTVCQYTCKQEECQMTEVRYTCLETNNEICENYSGSLTVCGCGTTECTGNAGAIFCYDSQNFCVPTQVTCDIC